MGTHHHQTTAAARGAALEGAREVLPIALGVAPLAVVLGVTIHGARIDHLGAWAGSFLMCAGSAQLAVVQLLDQGAAPLAIVGTAALINSRFALYSAGFSAWFADQPLRHRLLLAFPLVDQLYVLCGQRFARAPMAPRERRAYYVGASGVLVVGWVTVQAVALHFASSIPDPRSLELAAPLAFVGLLTGAVRDRATGTAALAGGLVAVVAAAAPHHLALIVGIGAGVAAGSAIEGRSS